MPVPRGQKTPPPDGFTGWDGRDPSGADCAEFDELARYRGTTQLALRMPPTVIGLDVDADDGRTGATTLAEAVQRWGPLPAGPWSSARDDGVSGIRFLAVPDGTVLVANLTFPDLRLGHVEIIQRHHRYAVVWPSVHPTAGTGYTWRGGGGRTLDSPPAVDDLPRLPAIWLAGLAGTSQAGERVLHEQAERFLAELPAGIACPTVLERLRLAERALQKPLRSRHDDTCEHVLRLLRLGEQGHPGTPAALGALRWAFARGVTADGSRTTASAEAEFDRMREGENGIALILSARTPSHRRGCQCRPFDGQPATRAALVGIIRTVLAASGEDKVQRLRWAARRLYDQVSAGHLTDDAAVGILQDLAARTQLGDHAAQRVIAAGRDRIEASR